MEDILWKQYVNTSGHVRKSDVAVKLQVITLHSDDSLPFNSKVKW